MGSPDRAGSHFKTPTSPVTQIDIASEKVADIIGLIRRRFPSHVFLAEESAHLQKEVATKSHLDRFRWVIDPLDGTVNYLHRIPQACVSIAVERDVPCVKAGGVYDPFREELFWRRKGKGATLNGRRIDVSPENQVAEIHPDQHGFRIRPSEKKRSIDAEFVTPFLKRCMDLRRFGSAALGSFPGSPAVDRKDIGNLIFVLGTWPPAGCLWKKAGGKISDFSGRPINFGFSSRKRWHPTAASTKRMAQPFPSGGNAITRLEQFPRPRRKEFGTPFLLRQLSTENLRKS